MPNSIDSFKPGQVWITSLKDYIYIDSVKNNSITYRYVHTTSRFKPLINGNKFTRTIREVEHWKLLLPSVSKLEALVYEIPAEDICKLK
jgi:hypothetical protein